MLRLAGAFGVHQLRRRLQRPRPQVERLLDLYAPDGLLPLTAVERRELPGISACINCGLCALVAGRLGEAHLPDLASAYLRAYPLVPEMAADLEGRPADLEAASAACPVSVPLGEVAAIIRRLKSSAEFPHSGDSTGKYPQI
jgi:ferredoxin